MDLLGSGLSWRKIVYSCRQVQLVCLRLIVSSGADLLAPLLRQGIRHRSLGAAGGLPPLLNVRVRELNHSTVYGLPLAPVPLLVKRSAASLTGPGSLARFGRRKWLSYLVCNQSLA